MAPGQRRPAASRTEGGRSRARAAAATMKSRATCAGAGEKAEARGATPPIAPAAGERPREGPAGGTVALEWQPA